MEQQCYAQLLLLEVGQHTLMCLSNSFQITAAHAHQPGMASWHGIRRTRPPCSHTDEAIVQALLERGADVCKGDAIGATPLIFASSKGHGKV